MKSRPQMDAQLDELITLYKSLSDKRKNNRDEITLPEMFALEVLDKNSKMLNLINAVEESQVNKLYVGVKSILNKRPKASPPVAMTLDEVANELYNQRRNLLEQAKQRCPENSNLTVVMVEYVNTVSKYLKDKGFTIDQLQGHDVLKKSKTLTAVYNIYMNMNDKRQEKVKEKVKEKSLFREQVAREARAGFGLFTQAGISPDADVAKEAKKVAVREHPDKNPNHNDAKLKAANALRDLEKDGLVGKYREEYVKAKEEQGRKLKK